jgi:hypothetical protein
MMTRASFFHEEQRFQQNPAMWLIDLLLVGEIVLFVGLLVGHFLFGLPIKGSAQGLAWTGPFLILLSLGLLVFFGRLRMTTEVGADGLGLALFPVHKRYALEQIVQWEPLRYRPLLQYGGWGIRYGRSGRGQGWGWAYTVSGNRGVRLRLADGRSVLIGTRRPEELAQALAAAQQARAL